MQKQFILETRFPSYTPLHFFSTPNCILFPGITARNASRPWPDFSRATFVHVSQPRQHSQSRQYVVILRARRAFTPTWSGRPEGSQPTNRAQFRFVLSSSILGIFRAVAGSLSGVPDLARVCCIPLVSPGFLNQALEIIARPPAQKKFRFRIVQPGRMVGVLISTQGSPRVCRR